MFKTIYPDYPWQLSKFVENIRFNEKFWTVPSNHRLFLDHLADVFEIKQVQQTLPTLLTLAPHYNTTLIDVGLV